MKIHKSLCTILKATAVVAFALWGWPSAKAQQTNNGDEQGLELGRLDLPQDSVAVREAITGWWAESQKTLEQRMQWFNDVKFGCFIHWGVYSVPGGEWDGRRVGGYAEHLMRSRKIPLAEYKEKLVEPFNPIDFDADEWMRLTKEAGMRYFIVTAKHHDGFAMFFSDAYPYDMRLTRFPRDPMRELRDAARKYDIKFGFYYSHAFDWEHPDAPGNDWDYDNPGGDKLLHGKDWWLAYPQFLSNSARYVDEKSIPQIRELMLNYDPDLMWFDTPHKLPLFENLRILKAIRDISPETVVINGRLARTGVRNFGDYLNTGDRAAYFRPAPAPFWESIPTTNESYGYSRHDTSHKSVAHFVRLLASATAKGGNILMNVGPMGNGQWDERDVEIFRGVGEWLSRNGAAIYGNVMTGIPVQNWGVTTRKGDTLYLHVYDYPQDRKLLVGGLSAQVRAAFLLASGEGVRCTPLGTEDMLVELPRVCPDERNTVVALVLEKPDYQVGRSRLLLPDQTNILLTFDAELEDGADPSGRLTVSDGKVHRNYVDTWTTATQTITWRTRLHEATSYNVLLDYSKDKAPDAGVILLEINGEPREIVYTAQDGLRSSNQKQLGSISLPKGEHTIVLRGLRIDAGSQYLRPMSLILECDCL